MVVDAPKVSLPVNVRRILAAAALNVLCPETYSGNGGVGKVALWYGRHWSARRGPDPR
jgi:hypothetical protein